MQNMRYVYHMNAQTHDMLGNRQKPEMQSGIREIGTYSGPLADHDSEETRRLGDSAMRYVYHMNGQTHDMLGNRQKTQSGIREIGQPVTKAR